MNELRKRVIIDIDDTLINTHGFLEQELSEYYQSAYVIPYGIYWEDSECCMGDDLAIANMIMCNGNFYSEVCRLTDTNKQALEMFLSDKSLDPIIVSAETKFEAIKDKVLMLEKMAPDLDRSRIIFTPDKSLIHADYIVDDHIGNLDACSKYMVPIQYMSECARHKNERHPNNYYKVTNLLDAYNLIKNLERRGSCEC